jgi:hypothetical protein
MMRTKWYLLFNVWYKYCGCDGDDDVCGMETQDDWIVSELWDMGFWSVNRLYVDNLRFPGIGKLYQNFGGNFGRLLYENCIKKNTCIFFLVPNRRKVTLNVYESVGYYSPCPIIRDKAWRHKSKAMKGHKACLGIQDPNKSCIYLDQIYNVT